MIYGAPGPVLSAEGRFEALAFPVQDSTLSETALAGLIATEYRLPRPPGCRFWRKGMADTYQVLAGNTSYYLKVHRPERRSRHEVEEEVRLLHHLLDDGVGVCEPVASASGESVLDISAPEGVRFAVLYRAVEGVSGTTGAHRRALGRMVARMHQCADRIDPPYDRHCLELERVLDDNLEPIRGLMANRGDDYQLIERIASHAKALVTASLAPRPPEHGVCHGDLHGGDVLYPDDDRPVIFDFESSGTGWRALDIAVFGGSVDWMDTSEESQARRQREVGEFLEGYTSVRALTGGEEAVLRLDSAVHHIFLMGLVLRYWTRRDGWHWANGDFIDWHMKWFQHWAQHHAV